MLDIELLYYKNVFLSLLLSKCSPYSIFVNRCSFVIPHKGLTFPHHYVAVSRFYEHFVVHQLGYGLGGPGFESRYGQGFYPFCKTPKLALGPNHLHAQ